MPGIYSSALLFCSISIICARGQGVVVPSEGSRELDLTSVLSVGPISLEGSPVTMPGGSRSYLPITVRLRNRSSKAITQYSISIDITSQAGTSKTVSWAEDLTPIITATSMPGALPVPNSSLNPGEEHSITQQVPLDSPGDLIVRATPKIKQVVFGDCTGLGDSKELARVFAGRRQIAENYSRFIGMVQEAEAAKEPMTRYRELIATESEARKLQGQGPLGAYYQRLDRYLNARGTPEFNLMMQIDTAVRDGMLKHSMPAGEQLK